MRATTEHDIVREDCLVHTCIELTAIKRARSEEREIDIIYAAYCRAQERGWGEDDEDLRGLFRHVATCLGWPVPDAVKS